MKLKVRNAVIGAILYLYLLGQVAALGAVAVIAFLIYVALCMYMANQMILGAERRYSYSSGLRFHGENATRVFGDTWRSFYYVFDSPLSIGAELNARIEDALRSKLECSELLPTVLMDVDRTLPQPEKRMFRLTSAPLSTRGYRVTFLCTTTQTKSVQGIRWWILVRGLRDPNKVFWRYFFAPVTVPFNAVPYLRGEFEPLHGLRSVDAGFFNFMDVEGRVREMELVAYEAVVSTLNSFGVDTSNLKEQRSQVLNVNVGGRGKATIASIVQGAFNRVTGEVTSG